MRAAEMLRAVRGFSSEAGYRDREEAEGRAAEMLGRGVGMAGRAEFGCVRERYIMEYARGLVPGILE